MGIEFLNEGELFVDRSEKDASELLDIKAGKWTLEQIKKLANELFKLAKIAYDNSKLPEEIDYNKVNKLCVKLIQTHFRNKIKI